MRATALLLPILLLVASIAQAQENSAVNLLDSPIKNPEGSVVPVGEVLVCQVQLSSTAALFGIDTVDRTAPVKSFTTGELFSPYRVWRTDEACNILSSWSTAQPPTATMTGIAVDQSPTSYWAVDANASILREFIVGIGTPTGRSCPLPSGFVVGGPAVIDDNEPATRIAYVQDIARDLIVGIRLDDCSVFCSFSNPDNNGQGAFGNGLGDAVNPQACNGAGLVLSSGTINEGQVVRIGQIDCAGNYCPDRWDIRQFSVFINGIDEFLPSSQFRGDPGSLRYVVVVDNVTGEKKVVCVPGGLDDCQGTDANSSKMSVNGDQEIVVQIDTSSSVSTALQRFAGSNGKFVFHLNAGRPGDGTVTQLLDLGLACFPFINGSPSVVGNNIGKTNVIGESNYFGASVANPPRTPTFTDPTQPLVDTANLPAGSEFTGQAVMLNPASSSIRGASLTNAILYEFQ